MSASGRSSDLNLELLAKLCQGGCAATKVQHYMSLSDSYANDIARLIKTPETLIKLLGVMNANHKKEFIKLFFARDSENGKAIVSAVRSHGHQSDAAYICLALVTHDV